MKKFKIVLSIVLAIIMATTMILPVFAENYATSGTCGENVTWKFDVPTRTLTISGEGEMYDGWFNEESPWSTYKSIIKTVVIEDGVTYIGWYNFQEHTALTNIILADSVKRIGNHAFENCTALNSIIFPNSVSIDDYAFSSCTALKDVTFGEYISRIGNGAFDNCYSLENVYINNINNWCNIDFYDDGSNPLCYAENLYLNGELVTNLVIPVDVTRISDYAFYSCDSLKTVTIHENVFSIGENSFRKCNSLSSINVSENNEAYKSIDDALFSKNMITLLLYPAEKSSETYVVPNDVLIIKEYAFYNNNYLKSIIIPDTVATIGEYTFYDCDALAQIIIPDDIVSIGNYAFSNSSNPDVYYSGTKEQWNSVSIGYDNYFNNIHYNCINPDGHYTLTKVVNPSTCRDEGYSEYTCPCGYTIQKDYTYLDHTPGEWNTSYNPTCTNSGYKYQRCTVCRIYLAEESIPATGHTAGEWQSIAPTCTESGLEGKCCTTCGGLIEGEIIAALGGSHTFGEWEKVDNRNRRTCSTCGYIEYKLLSGDLNSDGYTSAIDARIILQHVAGFLEIDSKYKDIADLNENGNITTVDARIILQILSGLIQHDNCNILKYSGTTIEEERIIANAGEKVTVTVNLSEKSSISALSFDIVYDATAFKPVEMNAGNLASSYKLEVVNDNFETGKARATLATPTTFEDSGTVCTLKLEALKDVDSTISINVIEACDAYFNDVENISNKLNLNLYKNEVEEPTTEPTPDDPTTEPTEPDDPTTEPTEPDDPCKDGHDYSNEIVVKKATCKESGIKQKNCKVCGDTIAEAIPAIGKCEPSDWIYNKQASCETDGEKHQKCKYCGDILNVEVIPAYGHNYEKVIEPYHSCSTSINTWEECTNCGNIINEVVINAPGHNYTWYTISVATCETDGVMLGECSKCEDIDIKATPKTGHNYVNGICVNCTGYNLGGSTNPTCTIHSYTWETIVEASCTKEGVCIGTCSVCQDTFVDYHDATGHNMINGACENCDYTENVGNEDDNNNNENNNEVTDPSDDCGCNCHKSGISNFFFKFALFFQKLFGSNKECACGIAHY